MKKKPGKKTLSRLFIAENSHTTGMKTPPPQKKTGVAGVAISQHWEFDSCI